MSPTIPHRRYPGSRQWPTVLLNVAAPCATARRAFLLPLCRQAILRTLHGKFGIPYDRLWFKKRLPKTFAVLIETFGMRIDLTKYSSCRNCMYSNQLTYTRWRRWKSDWSYYDNRSCGYDDCVTCMLTTGYWVRWSACQWTFENLVTWCIRFPRTLDDDYAINANIKRSLFHKFSYIVNAVRKFSDVTCETNEWLIILPTYVCFSTPPHIVFHGISSGRNCKSYPCPIHVFFNQQWHIMLSKFI